jgi:hypothetical protein
MAVHHRLVRVAPSAADGRVATAGAGAAAGKGPRRLSHPMRKLAGRCPHLVQAPLTVWQPGKAQIAAVSGADRRSAKIARAGMNQSREAHLAERSLHSPEGALSWTDERSWRWVGYAIAGAGNAVGLDVGVAVGSPPPSRTGEARRPVCGAGLRSLPAKQHAPKARPSPRHRPWPASSRLPYSKGHRSPGAAGPATGQQRAGPGGCGGPSMATQDHYRARLSDRWLSRSLPGGSCTSPAGRRARR